MYMRILDILTAFPPAHQFCTAVISVLATPSCEVLDEIDPFWEVLFELAESHETAVDHPEGTSFGVGFDAILRSWGLCGYGDDVLVCLHVWILFDGFRRVDAFQEGLREAVSEAKARWDFISITGYQRWGC